MGNSWVKWTNEWWVKSWVKRICFTHHSSLISLNSLISLILHSFHSFHSFSTHNFNHHSFHSPLILHSFTIILHSSSLMSEMSDEWSLISLITHCIILLNPGKDKSIHQREINHLHVKCVQEVSVMKFFLTHLTLENVITLMFGMCCQFLIGFFHLQTLLENYHLLFRILN